MLSLGARQAVDQLSELFPALILQDQDCFRGEAGWKELLQLVPDSKVVEKLEQKWARSADRSSDDKWDDLRAEIKALYKTREERVSSYLTRRSPFSPTN
jgi:DNA primase small subunit